MKKFLSVLLCQSLAGLAFSQSTIYGIFGGAQATSVHYSVRGKTQPSQSKPGAQGGLILKIPFENQLFFSPSLYYSLKGYKVTLKDTLSFPGIDIAADDVSVHTVELAPLFHLNFSDHPQHFFVQFGPAFDVAFSGTEKLNYSNGTVSKRPMPFNFEAYGRITSTAIMRLGYENSKGFLIFAHYDFGLGSMNDADDGPQIKHRLFGLSIGKFFNRNPNVFDTRVKEK